MPYIKFCPDHNCGRENDEDADLCSRCRELLTNVPTTWVTGIDPVGEPVAASQQLGAQQPEPPQPGEELPIPDLPLDEPASSQPEAGPAVPRPIPATRGIGSDLLQLEFTRGGRLFTVRDGQILGRDDGTDDFGRVNIPANAGVDVGYVSRWHCRFHRRAGQWYVRPLAPEGIPGATLRQANPTYLGNQELAVGQEHALRHGDLLTLVDVELRVHLRGAL